MGWAFIVICAQNLLVNIIMITVDITLYSFESFKERNYQKNQEKLQEKRVENLMVISSQSSGMNHKITTSLRVQEQIKEMKEW